MQLTKKHVLPNFVFFSSKIGRKPSQPLTGNTESICRSLIAWWPKHIHWQKAPFKTLLHPCYTLCTPGASGYTWDTQARVWHKGIKVFRVGFKVDGKIMKVYIFVANLSDYTDSLACSSRSETFTREDWGRKRRRTFVANLSEHTDSWVCSSRGEILTNIKTFEFPPSEFCNRYVSLLFLNGTWWS